MRFFKNPRFASLAVAATLGLGLMTAAPLAGASSLTSTQISAILNLLQSFGASSATISNVQAALEHTGTSTSVAATGPAEGPSLPPTANGCAVIATSLHVGSTDGSSGGEVTRLQKFLAKDKAVYPQGLVTGYFGSETEQAVQRWQASHNIVATGTPSSTGYGTVGPRTRSEMDHEMETECEGSVGSTGDHASSSENASSTSSESGAGSSEGSAASSTAVHSDN